jgi:hypothetical protein
MIRHTLIFAICLTLFGCRQSTTKVGNTNSVDTSSQIADPKAQTKTNFSDTSNQYIYDFMKVVIADQKLDLGYGLTVEPEQSSAISQDDNTFLKTLLIEKSKPKSDTGAWRNMTTTIDQLPKCLTRNDIDEMLLRKEELSNFNWDNSRLGFSASNDKNWYCFSRPLFSKDRKKVVMMIRSLCPGLCGTGWTVVFTKQDNKWTSQIGGKWIH